MFLRRSLIGLFVFTFLLSSIALAVLIIDDRKDLSSRANEWLVSSHQNVLPGIKQYVVDPSPFPDQKVWLSSDVDNLYFHRQLPISLRLLQSRPTNSELQNLLGSDFQSGKLLKNITSAPSGWTNQTYEYTFFKDKKYVSLWSLQDGKTILGVYPITVSLGDVEKFLIDYQSQNKVLGANAPDESAQLATLVRPSVVMVLNHFCAEMQFLQAPGFALSNQKYPFCFTSIGSGFFVNTDGYVATNGHVVKNLPLTTIYYSVSSGNLDQLLVDFLQVYLSQSGSVSVDKDAVTKKVKEAHASKESIYQLAGLVGELYKKKYLKFQNEKNDYYLQLGDNAAKVTNQGVEESTDVIKAEYVDANYIEPNDQAGFVSSDVALLKANGKNFPALPLGEIQDTTVGSNLLVVGFPGAAMGAGAMIVDTTTISEPTFTRGVVSAIKQAKGDNRKLIQTDAAINHGNSGGPAITSQGKVVGIATYGLQDMGEASNYNFLRDIQDLKDLMSKNRIENNTGDPYTLWKMGLENYWLSYFKYAKKDFEKLKSIYPQHPLVEKYLKETDKKVNTVDDITPKFTRQSRQVFIKLSGSVMAISLILIICLSIINYFDAKKKKELVIENVPTF